MAIAISSGEFDLGISICGTGNGINMVVNKHQGIRSALCWNEEISRLARAHNDANVCALPGRFISESEAYLIVKTFLETTFEGGRHTKRIGKIPLKMY
jgi:ribose 5-phosphate isomerase B